MHRRRVRIVVSIAIGPAAQTRALRTGYHVVRWLRAAEEIVGDGSPKTDFTVFPDTDVPQQWNGTLWHAEPSLAVLGCVAGARHDVSLYGATGEI